MASDSNSKTRFWPDETLGFLAVWAGLVALLALTMAISMVDAGAWNIVANLGIALIKAALVMWVFMHLNEMRGLILVFALGALLWIAILFGLTMADYLTRPY